MREIDHDTFVSVLKPCDVGIILAKNLFATMQNWRRVKEKAPLRASHAFMMRETPKITEANGLHISNATILKNIGDKTKCWIFRNENWNFADIDDMQDYMDGAVENGGTYSIGGIMQFALQFIGIRKKLTDEQGSFCSEFDIKTVRKTPTIIVPGHDAWAIDPSQLLSWLMTPEATAHGWFQVGYYNGDGKYFANDNALRGPIC